METKIKKTGKPLVSGITYTAASAVITSGDILEVSFWLPEGDIYVLDDAINISKDMGNGQVNAILIRMNPTIGPGVRLPYNSDDTVGRVINLRTLRTWNLGPYHKGYNFSNKECVVMLFHEDVLDVRNVPILFAQVNAFYERAKTDGSFALDLADKSNFFGSPKAVGISIASKLLP